ncbi:MAG TPA: propanediol utilization protein, partial [Elusimicrobia bacterium]|nr:propanediol utilization protein [Elusimicrobiota bacterium]
AGAVGGRATVFEGAVVRVSNEFRLELHLDNDEANAAGVQTGEMACIV